MWVVVSGSRIHQSTQSQLPLADVFLGPLAKHLNGAIFGARALGGGAAQIPGPSDNVWAFRVGFFGRWAPAALLPVSPRLARDPL